MKSFKINFKLDKKNRLKKYRIINFTSQHKSRDKNLNKRNLKL